MKIKKINNRGFSARELMISIVVILIVFVFILFVFSKTNVKGKYRNFRTLASSFATEVSNLRNSGAAFENGAYLYDLVDKKFIDPYVSPFDNSETCDLYESRIEINNSGIPTVTLKCSNYLIYKELTTKKDFTIYEVSKWDEKKKIGDDVQNATLYNYVMDGKEQFEDYYMEKQFLIEYNKKNGSNISNVNNLNSEHKLVSKTYYRTIKEVS